jgi:hypothetical protein
VFSDVFVQIISFLVPVFLMKQDAAFGWLMQEGSCREYQLFCYRDISNFQIQDDFFGR